MIRRKKTSSTNIDVACTLSMFASKDFTHYKKPNPFIGLSLL
jgi:hypothetical protein